MALSRSSRRGGTTFQVFTFIMVAGLGAWMGAEYVGVDVQHLAYTALDEAQVIESIPEEWRPAAPLPELGDGEGQVPFEKRSAELLSELDNLREEVAHIRHSVDAEDSSNHRDHTLSFSKAPPVRRQATLAFWTRLRQITAEVNELHNGVELALTPETASTVFDIRGRAFDYGSRAIDSVDFNEVDQQAVDAGYRIAKWYRAGSDLYNQASDIWEGRLGKDVHPSVEKQLEQTKQQHAREAELVRQLTARTEEILMRRYAVEFPVLSL